MNEAKEIADVVLVTGDHTAKVLEPGEQALDLPSTAVTPQRATILGFYFAIAALADDQFDAFRGEIRPERVTVVRFVADEPLGRVGKEAGVERGVDEFDFMR